MLKEHDLLTGSSTRSEAGLQMRRRAGEAHFFSTLPGARDAIGTVAAVGQRVSQLVEHVSEAVERRVGADHDAHVVRDLEDACVTMDRLLSNHPGQRSRFRLQAEQRCGPPCGVRRMSAGRSGHPDQPLLPGLEREAGVARHPRRVAA